MTNNVKATKQTKKNPLDIEAGKYRLWEKLRRDRFNAGLESLSASLPDYEAGVSKWTKGDIVERALNYIKALQAQRIPDDLQRRIKGLKRQNSKLREIIRSKLAREMDHKEFSKLNLQEIQSLINKFEEAKANKENAPQKPGGEDHSYSLCSQGTPEPDLEVSSEEVIEDVPVTSEAPPSSSATVSSTSLVSTGTALTLKPITILSTTTGALLNPTSWTLPQHSLIAIDPNQIVSSVPLMMRPLIKLPLPRLPRPSKITKSPLKKSLEEKKAGKDLDKPKNPDKELEATISIKDNIQSLETEDKSSSQVDLPSTNLDEFDLKASSTLPDAILASEDPLSQEIESTSEEISKEDKSKEGPTNVENKAKTVCKLPPINSSKSASKVVEIHKVQSGKKSKSSYSIAALCQISVNIGGDALVASESMVNSPGVVSLNSVGTASPSVTPVPSTPPAPTPPIEKKEADKVIQELKPVPPSVLKQAVIQSKETREGSTFEEPLPSAPTPVVRVDKPKAFLSDEGLTVRKEGCVLSVSKKTTDNPVKEAEGMSVASKTPVESSSRKDNINAVEYSGNHKCEEKEAPKKELINNHQIKSSSKQWPTQIQTHQSYQQMSLATPHVQASIPKDCNKSVAPQKDLGKSLHYSNSSSKVPISNQGHGSQSHLQPSQVQQVQHYQVGYAQGPIQGSLGQQQQQAQQQVHSQQHHQDFNYGNSSNGNNNSSILNEFLGHPLQTVSSLPSSSLLGSASQFHQGESNNHRYSYNNTSSSATTNPSYQNNTSNNAHHLSQASSSSIDYHQQQQQQQQQHSGVLNSSSTANNQVLGGGGGNILAHQNEQYLPYNRSYYAGSQNHYELLSSSNIPSSTSSSSKSLQQHKAMTGTGGQQQQQVLHHLQHQLQGSQQPMNNTMMQPNTFSVNQLVSSSSKTQRKVNKRSSTTAPSSYEVPLKKPNRNLPLVNNEKDSSPRMKEDKKTSKSSSRSTSSSVKPSSSMLRKGNYSAESLIMDPSQYSGGNLGSLDFQNQQHQQLLQGSSKSKMDFSSGWAASGGSTSSSSMMVAPSVDNSVSGAQFCSMSPSPFTQDLEFTMFISGNEVVPGSTSYTGSSQVKNNFKTNQTSANHKMSANHSQSQNVLFDNSNLFPLPTLTPPSVVDDPYAGFMNPSSQVHYHHHHHHQSSSYHNNSLSSSSTTPQKQNYNNTSNKLYSSSTSSGSSGRFNNDYSSPLASNSNNTNPPNGVPSSSSSLVNFNLSTIFPEINEKFSGSSGGALVPPATSTSSSSSSQTASSSKVGGGAILPLPAASSTDFRQVPVSGASDILPHSIAMLGHAGQQAGGSFMAFNGASTSTTLSGLQYHQQQPQQQ